MLDVFLWGCMSRTAAGKQTLAALIRRQARDHEVDERLALAIVLAEANLDARAVAPSSAQGVTRPFDPEQNVMGELAHLCRLQKRLPDDQTDPGRGAADRPQPRRHRTRRWNCCRRCFPTCCCSTPSDAVTSERTPFLAVLDTTAVPPEPRPVESALIGNFLRKIDDRRPLPASQAPSDMDPDVAFQRCAGRRAPRRSITAP